MAENEPNYIKVTQLASSDSATTVGAIFPDSQYLDIYGTDSGQVTILSDSNEKIPTSKMVKQAIADTAASIPSTYLKNATVTDSYTWGVQLKLTKQDNTNVIFKSQIIGITSGNQYNYPSDMRLTAGSGIAFNYNSPKLTFSLADNYGDTKNPYAAKTANYVLAGPISGNASTPSFRALVESDIPSLSASKIASGTFDANLIPNLNADKIIGGGTISYNGSDTPLYLKGNSAATYIGFKDSNSTALGYFGVNANKKPVFYDTSDHQLAYSSDVPIKDSDLTNDRYVRFDQAATITTSSSHILTLKSSNTGTTYGEWYIDFYSNSSFAGSFGVYLDSSQNFPIFKGLYSGGEYKIAHEGNLKTVGGQSLIGSGDIAANGCYVHYIDIPSSSGYITISILNDSSSAFTTTTQVSEYLIDIFGLVTSTSDCRYGIPCSGSGSFYYGGDYYTPLNSIGLYGYRSRQGSTYVYSLLYKFIGLKNTSSSTLVPTISEISYTITSPYTVTDHVKTI